MRAHGYHLLSVKQIIQETEDAKSFVLDVPPDLRDLFAYEPGQFCTFRIHLGDVEHLRSYSMSSAPETDSDLTVTVKRVADGIISNWFLDHVSVGDVLETTKPAGVFCLRDSQMPVVAFCGGSGITPVMAIIKRALVSTQRRITLVYANRDLDSTIFLDSLRRLSAEYPDRLETRYHLDVESGFIEAEPIAEVCANHSDADFYICGPTPFMDLAESTLLGAGVSPRQIFIERFAVAGDREAAPDHGGGDAVVGEGLEPTESVTIIMKGRPTTADYQRGDTVLETARRAALRPPFSCEAGSCATCMALVREGSAAMRVNNALTPEEVAEGWILTCQALPTSKAITVEYESI